MTDALRKLPGSAADSRKLAHGSPVVNFANFCNQPFDAFARKLQQSRVTWIFHHIPKTAGSSLVTELRFCFAPYFNLGTAAAKQPAHLSETEKLMRGVEIFIAENEQTSHGSVSGHLVPLHLRRLIESVPNAGLFTFLRDPVARYISEYRYVRTPSHPAHEAIRRRYASIDDYVDDKTTHNGMWKFLSGGAKEASQEVIERQLRKYAFIGTLEDFNLAFEFLTALTGHPKTPSARNNVTEKRSDNEVEMSDALLERITAAHQADIAVYNYVQRHLAARREDMVKFVSDRRKLYAGQAID